MAEENLALNIQLAMETQSFDQQITSINRQMRVVQAEFQAASTTVGSFGSETERLAGQQSSLSRQIELSGQRVTVLSEAHQRARAILETNVQANVDLRQQVERTTQAYNASVVATGENSAESNRLRTELGQLNAAFDASNGTVNSNARTVDNLNIRLLNTQRQENALRAELTQTTTAIEQQNNGLQHNAEVATSAGNTHTQLGTTVAGAGKVMGAGLIATGLALGGVAVAGVKMGDEVKMALNGLQAGVGYSDESMKSMKDTMVAIYNNNFGENFADIGKSMEEIGKQTGATGKELEGLTQNGLMLRDTFGFEINESIRSANMMMNQFGLSGKDAYNLIAQGAQWGLDKNGDLLDTINEYSGTFKAQGFSAEEMFNMFQNGAESGTFSVDKLGDAVKEFGIRSKDGSKGTMEAFQALGLDANKLSADFATGGDVGKSAFGEVNKKLLDMKDPLAQNQIGVALWGSMWEDLGVKGIKSLTDTKGEISKSTDALKKINDVKYDTFGQAMQGIKRNLETGMLLPLGDKVLPVLSQFSTWITAHMPEIQATASKAFEVIGAAMTEVGKALNNYIIPAFEALWSWIEPNIPAIKKIITDTFNDIKGLTEGVMALIKAIWEKYGEEIKLYITGVFEVIKTVVSTAMKVIQDIINIFTALISGDWKGVWDGIKNLTSDLWNGIKGVISGVLKIIQAEIRAVLKTISDIMGGAWNSIKSATETIWNGIKTAITTPILAARDIVKDAIDAIMGFFRSIKLPDIKVHTVWGGPGDAIPYPSFNIEWKEVKWNAKGGIFTRPTLLNGNQGVGEAGAEAVLPISELDGIVASAIIKAGGVNKGVNQTVNIYSPIALSPSETARQVKNASRQLALGF